MLLPLHTGILRLAMVSNAPSAIIQFITYFKELLLVVVIAEWLFGTLAGNWRLDLRLAPAIALWVVFLIYLAALTVLAHGSTDALYDFRVYAEPIVGGLAVGGVLRQYGAESRLPRILAWSTIIVAVLSLLQTIFPFAPLVVAIRQTTADASGQLPTALTVSIINKFRAFATFADPNDLGFFAVIALVSGFAMTDEDTGTRRLRGGARISAVLVLMLSFSRSAALALGAGAVTMIAAIVLLDPRWIRLVTGKRVLVSAAALTLMIGAVATFGRAAPQIQHLLDTVNGADPSAVGHLESLAEGWEAMRRHAVGFGLGTVGPRARVEIIHVESSFLQVGLEAGIAGMLLYLLAWAATTWGALLRADSAVGTERRWALITLGILVAQAGAYVFLPTIVSLQTGALIFAHVGIVVSGQSHT